MSSLFETSPRQPDGITRHHELSLSIESVIPSERLHRFGQQLIQGSANHLRFTCHYYYGPLIEPVITTLREARDRTYVRAPEQRADARLLNHPLEQGKLNRPSAITLSGDVELRAKGVVFDFEQVEARFR